MVKLIVKVKNKFGVKVENVTFIDKLDALETQDKLISKLLSEFSLRDADIEQTISAHSSTKTLTLDKNIISVKVICPIEADYKDVPSNIVNKVLDYIT